MVLLLSIPMSLMVPAASPKEKTNSNVFDGSWSRVKRSKTLATINTADGPRTSHQERVLNGLQVSPGISTRMPSFVRSHWSLPTSVSSIEFFPREPVYRA